MGAEAQPLRVIDARVPMRDGTALAADIVVLDDQARHPVLLVRTPYSRADARSALDPVAIARRGWALVIQDVRGLGDSEGEFSPFLQEVADGEDTVDWCSTQPWSDGRVAMRGGSYLGATQWLAAVSGHPALKAIAPTFTASDYRDGWTYEGGAFAHGFITPWAAKFAAFEAEWDALLRRPVHENGVAERFPPYTTWLDRHDDAYWNSVSVERRYGELDLPVFHVGGWYDTFCEGTIRNYVGMSTRAPSAPARRRQRLVIGPWTHHAMWERVQGDLDFGPDADRTAEMRVVIENWLRRAIDDDEPPGGASIFVMGANRWLDLESWPPPAKPLRLYLHGEESSEGRLLRQPAEGAVQRLTFDPDDPVPTVGGRGIDPVLPTAGPVDQQAVESRDDVLVYTSDPFPQNVTILGIVTASLRVSAAAASADVAVKLCLVEPRGRSINIVDSIHRDGYEPGRAQRVELALGTTAVEVPRGARLRVQVSGSNFPRFDRNPALVANGVVAELFVHSDATHPSWIEIPLAEAESA